jgi:non-lysosomal glucosylceramidase
MTRQFDDKGVVPHDLGSPSEQPWVRTNAYNFQDVSRWKDLGPKFVLQVYRDYRYLRCGDSGAPCTQNSSSNLDGFLTELYPVLKVVMQSTEAFDADGDGMIENGGFPDQTYDIWTATGVHAYCGGVSANLRAAVLTIMTRHAVLRTFCSPCGTTLLQLWVAACEAMAKMAALCSVPGDASYYNSLAGRARRVYTEKLWNGRYLNYDSSKSAHHDSIMADMLAGQWYARACGLPAVLPPHQAYSCFRTIFQHNVVEFGAGRLLGAVNGMRPPASYSTAVGSQVGDRADATGTGGDEAESMVSPPLSAPIVAPSSAARVDSSCMQSREVWTGTTYALAAAMILEAAHTSAAEGTDDHDAVQKSTLCSRERADLLSMAHRTAQGIHDGGWQEFGYWFATPEAWELSGNYRSLGYMRALGIWAMQFAKENDI